MKGLKKLKPIIYFHLALNAIVVLFVTGASYIHVPLEGFKDHAIYFIHLCALQTTVAGILYFLSLSKWLFRIGFSLLFIAYCSFSFWAYAQDISITPSLIQAVLETTPDIAIDLITMPYALFILAALVTLWFVLKWHSRIDPRRGIWLFLLPALGCIFLYFGMERYQRGILMFRLPYNVISALKEYQLKPSLNLNRNLPEVVSKTDSLKIVFVLGETVRADHIGLNGYARNTTPLLSKRGDVISLKKLFTDKTVTATSVPQLLTDQNLEDEPRPYTSVFSVLNKAGFHTAWIGNQTLEKSYQPITETNTDIILVDKYRSVFSFDKELDEVMLKPMDSLLNTHNKSFITLHMIGSHWWYENRYTDKHRVYKPVIDSKYIPSLTREQIVNSYDNTIIYLDYFLDEIIGRLQKEGTPTAMIYISDHGELLGENGKYLHAQEDDALKNPAYIFWFSESFKEKFPEKVEKVIRLVDQQITADIVYPNLLELSDIDIIE